MIKYHYIFIIIFILMHVFCDLFIKTALVIKNLLQFLDISLYNGCLENYPLPIFSFQVVTHFIV